jgi:hypothetical protein
MTTETDKPLTPAEIGKIVSRLLWSICVIVAFCLWSGLSIVSVCSQLTLERLSSFSLATAFIRLGGIGVFACLVAGVIVSIFFVGAAPVLPALARFTELPTPPPPDPASAVEARRTESSSGD